MSTSQEAKLQFRYEMTGNGIQAVNRLTGEVLKLAAAEETAIGRAKQLGQEMQRSSGSSSAGGFGSGPFTGGGNVDRSVMAAPRPGFRDDNRRGGESELVRAISRLVDELHRLPEALRGMVAAGPQMGMGFGGQGVYIPQEFRHKPGSMQSIESGQAAEDFRNQLEAKRAGGGSGFMKSMPGRAASASAAIMTAASMAGRYYSAYSEPFTQERDRARMFLGQNMQDLHDYVFVGTDEGSRIKREIALDPVRYGVKSQYRQEMYSLQQIRDERLDRRSFYDQGFGHLAPLGATGRETLGERQRYALSQQMLPAKDRLSQAELEYEVANRTKFNLAAQDRKYQDRITELQREIIKLDTPQNHGSKQWPEIASTILQYRKEADQLQGFQRSNIGELAKARDRFADAERARAEARTGVAEVGLGDLQNREGVARSQAQRLGMLGVSGNAMADQAMQIIQQTGDISLVPPEIVAQAAAKYPEQVARLAEKSGQQYVQGAKQFAPDEYRDTVPDITAAVDKKMGEIRQDKTDAVGTSLDRLVQSIVDQMDKLNIDLGRRILDAENLFKREMYLRNAGN